MTEPTRPLSIRLKTTDIEQLADRAKRISGTPTGVARELILSGLSDGDPFAQAERLLKIERKLAVIGQDVHAIAKSGDQQTKSLSQIEAINQIEPPLVCRRLQHMSSMEHYEQIIEEVFA